MELTELKQLILDEVGPAVTLALEGVKAGLPEMIAAEMAKEVTPDKLRALIAATAAAPVTMTRAAYLALTPAEQMSLAKSGIKLADEKE